MATIRSHWRLEASNEGKGIERELNPTFYLFFGRGFTFFLGKVKHQFESRMELNLQLTKNERKKWGDRGPSLKFKIQTTRKQFHNKYTVLDAHQYTTFNAPVGLEL